MESTVDLWCKCRRVWLITVQHVKSMVDIRVKGGKYYTSAGGGWLVYGTADEEWLNYSVTGEE